jgi:hypothetical protein
VAVASYLLAVNPNVGDLSLVGSIYKGILKVKVIILQISLDHFIFDASFFEELSSLLTKRAPRPPKNHNFIICNMFVNYGLMYFIIHWHLVFSRFWIYFIVDDALSELKELSNENRK